MSFILVSVILLRVRFLRVILRSVILLRVILRSVILGSVILMKHSVKCHTAVSFFCHTSESYAVSHAGEFHF
jgi:hypothetical protein